MPTITVYLAESDRKRKRNRTKWAIPLLVGLTAAFAFGRPKTSIAGPALPIVAPPPAVVTSVETTVVKEPPPPPPALPAYAVVAPARIDFGDGPMNRGVAAQLATLRNDGGQPIARITTAVEGPFIATNGCAGGLAPGAECIVAVTFNTQQAGKFAGALTIATDAVRSRVPLQGSVAPPRVVPPPPAPVPPPAPADVPAPPPVVVPAPPRITRVLCADPPALHFTRVGKKTITLTNPESIPLRVLGVDVLGETGKSATGYVIDSGKCIGVLGPGQRCKFTVLATPLAIHRGETIALNVYYEDPTTGQKQVASTKCGRNRR